MMSDNAEFQEKVTLMFLGTFCIGIVKFLLQTVAGFWNSSREKCKKRNAE